jgi:hypothetical protein
LWCNCDHGGVAFEGGLIAGGAGEGPLLRDAWFSDAFLCAVQQRRGVVLGIQLGRTSDALRCFLLMGLMIGGGRKASVGLTAFCFTRAGWRQHHDHSIHARVRCGIEQRRCDGCFGRSKKSLRFVCMFDACERAGFAALLRFCGAIVIMGGMRLREVDCGRCWGGAVVA